MSETSLCAADTRGRRREAAHDGVAAHGAILELARSAEQHRRQRRRHPEVELQAQHGALEPVRRDADHGEIVVVDAKRAANRLRTSAEARLPVVVRNDDNRVGARPAGFVQPQETAGGRLHAQRREIVARHQQPVGPLRSAGLADVERHHAKRAQLRNRPDVLLQIEVLQPRRARSNAGFGLRLDQIDRRGVGDARDRLEHERLDPREHHGVHADADGQGQRRPRWPEPACAPGCGRSERNRERALPWLIEPAGERSVVSLLADRLNEA